MAPPGTNVTAVTPAAIGHMSAIVALEPPPPRLGFAAHRKSVDVLVAAMGWSVAELRATSSRGAAVVSARPLRVMRLLTRKTQAASYRISGA
jgi:hypothetical protein